MSLTVPGKILEISSIAGRRVGKLRVGDSIREAYLDFVPDAQPGDYVSIHAGFGIRQVNAAEAERTLHQIHQMSMAAGSGQ